MIFKLLYKEIFLAAHPNLFIFTVLGVLVIVPAYPYGMVFLFGCIAPFISFTYCRETNDIYYTALLPVDKSDIVKSKFLITVLAQMTQLLVSLPFAFINYVNSFDNPAGINANIAYYGFGFIVYAVFDFLFLTNYFKTAYKTGLAFFKAIIPSAFIVAFMETIVYIPTFEWLDTMSLNQLPILLAGLIIYIILTISAYFISKNRFNLVDL